MSDSDLSRAYTQMESGTPSTSNLHDTNNIAERLLDPDEYYFTESEYQTEVERQLKTKKDNSLKVIFSIWSTMMGSTVLVMPKMFRNASLIPAIISVLLIGSLTTYTAILITKLGKIYGNSTKDILDKAAPKYIRYTTFAATQLLFLGASVLFHVYIVESFMDFVKKKMVDTTPRLLMAAATAVIVFCVGLLKQLGPLVTASSYCIIIVIFCLVFIIIKSIMQFEEPCEVQLEGEYGVGWQGAGPVGALMSVLTLSFFCHNFLLNLLKESTRPTKHARNVFLAFTGTGVSYVLPSGLAVVAFRHCGDFQGDFIEMFQDAYADAARGAIITLVMVIYPIGLFVARKAAMDEIYGENMPFPYSRQVGYNFCFLLITSIPCALNVKLPVISALVGITGTYWSLLLPVYLFLKMKIASKEASIAFILCHSAMLILGCILILTTVLSVAGVIKEGQMPPVEPPSNNTSF